MSKTQIILGKLKLAGKKGVSTNEFLNDENGLYEFRSRITELRNEGYNIPPAIRLAKNNFLYKIKKPYRI